MNEWKKQVYDRYVTSGQSSARNKKLDSPSNVKNPYYQYVIRKYVSSDSKQKIVDLACGNGELIWHLQKAGYINIEGVDASYEQIKLAHNRGINEACLGTIEEYIENKKEIFDTIFMLDVLEHLQKDELFTNLPRILNALKKNGQVILTVPNAEGLFGMSLRYGDLSHEICFTRQSIKQLLTLSGFDEIKVFEIKPVVIGLKSLVRRLIWELFTLFPRTLMRAEAGCGGHILSRNILVVACKL